jgi:hypothetical protein
MGAVCVTNSSLPQSRYNCDLDLTVGRERQRAGAWRRSAAGLLADRHDADHTIRRATDRVDRGQQRCHDMRVQTVRTTP